MRLLITYVVLSFGWNAFGVEISEGDQAVLERLRRQMVQTQESELSQRLSTLGVKEFWVNLNVVIDQDKLFKDLGIDRFDGGQNLPSLPVAAEKIRSLRIEEVNRELLMEYVTAAKVDFHSPSNFSEANKATINSAIEGFFGDQARQVEVKFHQMDALPEKTTSDPEPVKALETATSEAGQHTGVVWDEMTTWLAGLLGVGLAVIVLTMVFMFRRFLGVIERQGSKLSASITDAMSAGSGTRSIGERPLPGEASPRALSPTTESLDQILSRLAELLQRERSVASLLAADLFVSQDFPKVMLLLGSLHAEQKEHALQQTDDLTRQKFHDFLRYQAQNLLANTTLLVVDAKELYSMAWLAAQDPQSIHRIMLTNSVALLSPRQLSSTLEEVNREERALLYDVLGSQKVAELIALGDIHIDSLAELQDVQLEVSRLAPALLQKVRKNYVTKREGGTDRILRGVARYLPQSQEQLLLATMKKGADLTTLSATNSALIGEWVKQLNVEDIREVFACFEPDLRAQVASHMPDITAKRVSNLVREVSPRSLELKAELIVWLEEQQLLLGRGELKDAI